MFCLPRTAARSIVFRSILASAFVWATAVFTFAAQPPQSGGVEDKHLDIESSAGDLHMGNDADARKAGLPLYPGARLRHDEDDSDALHLGLFTQAFGIKLVVAKYESDDAPEKVIAFYRDHLKKYGKVLECHTREHGGHAQGGLNDDDSDSDQGGGKHSKELKCEGDNSGPVTELKVGTQDDQHIVAVEPPSDGNKEHSRSIFALVYLRTRGKQGDI